MRIILMVVGIVLAVAVNGALWAVANRPVVLAPLPEGKLRSVSYAPFRDGQSPLTKVYASVAEIDQDLRLLSTQVAGIRTYTSTEGLEAVPGLARRHGLKVTMGAWLDLLKSRNEREIESVIQLANQHPDVITRVVVGNEVLLRGTMTSGEIRAAIRRVKAAVRQPVTYADVWEFWLKHPEMADEVDFITIHILPYWEDLPAGVDDAAKHLIWCYSQVAERYPGKPVLIGEIGWPTAGRARGPAMPGLVNKAQFVNAVVRTAEEQGFDYNIIEAFDQSWKIWFEGTVGGHWGLFTADRKPKFELSGTVAELPQWPVLFGISAALGLGMLALATGSAPGVLGFGGLALLTQLLGSGFLLAAFTSWKLNHYWDDVLLAAAILGLQAVLGLAVLAAVRGERSRRGPDFRRSGYCAFLILSLLAVVWTFLLIFDGRYRDFPIAEFLVPALGVPALALWCRRRGGDRLAALSVPRLIGLEPPPRSTGAAAPRVTFGAAFEAAPLSILLGAALALGAVAIVIAEAVVTTSWGNTQAWGWAGLMGALALQHGGGAVAAAKAASGPDQPPIALSLAPAADHV